MTKIKEKYDLQRTNRGFLISSITKNTVEFTPNILSYKLMRKMQPTKCTTGMVELAKQCAKGVILNWLQYLLNEMLEDVEQAQKESKTKFHHSWLLILISFVGW